MLENYRETASYLYTKVEFLGRNASPRTPNLGKNKMRIYFSGAVQSFGHAATNWYRHLTTDTVHVPLDNPLDTRPQIGNDIFFVFVQL